MHVTLPAISRSRGVKVQGPFLLQPAPVEFENGAQSRACDIAYVSCARREVGEGSKGKTGEEAGISVLAVAFSDGKVDLCLEVEKVEAEWTGTRGGGEEQWPSLVVYETIDLGLATTLLDAKEDVEEGLDDNSPFFVTDPIYPDTLYVYHDLGAHCLLMGRWLEEMLEIMNLDGDEEGDEEDDEKVLKEAERSLRSSQGTDVLWMLKTYSESRSSKAPKVIGMSVVNDVYLGYSLLVVTDSLQLVALELSLRVDPSATLSTPPYATSSSLPNRGVSDTPPAYLSLLDSPFTIPPPLDNPASIKASVPRFAIKSGNRNQPPQPLVITPDTLRLLGKTVETFRHSIRDLVESADSVQCRLELQMKELSRQLTKLTELRNMAVDLSKSTDGSLAGRLETVVRKQEELVQRTDKVLQRLMDHHEPVLSTFEKKWFDELKRLEKEVKGDQGGAGDRSLERRKERVEQQFGELKNVLVELKKREMKGDAGVGSPQRAPRVSVLDSPGGLGETQLRQLEIKLAEE